jgi:dimethylaniline monooxygenase (N-oxide forming)
MSFTKLINIVILFHATFQINWVPYLDELGEMIRAKPNLWSIFFKNPKLAYQCFFGPAVPAQYRLQGPNTWGEATKVIMSTEEEYRWPLETKRCMPLIVERKSYFYHIIAVALVVFVAILFCFLI